MIEKASTHCIPFAEKIQLNFYKIFEYYSFNTAIFYQYNAAVLVILCATEAMYLHGCWIEAIGFCK